jgi:hypothetical protein
MAKKDPQIGENVDREGNIPTGKTEGKEKQEQDSSNEGGKEGKTEVKNANASGLGSMGRNDEDE